jgi:MFS family permease
LVERLTATLDGLLTLPADTPADPEVARHFRRNFLVNAGDAAAWLFGVSFFSMTGILPVYASRLTDSSVLVGLVPALTDAGWFLPQLFLAPRVERLRRTMPAVLWLGVFERLPFLALALSVMWIGSLPRGAGITVFLILIAWRAVASGLIATPWQELIARIIPISHRGRFFAVSHLAGDLLGVGGATIAALLLASVPYPRNFAVCFALGCVGIFGSYGFFALTKEPSLERVPSPRETTRAYARRVKEILRSSANFRIFLASRALSYLGTMAYGFLAVYAIRQLRIEEAQAGVFSAILFGTGAVGYVIWGQAGDQLGHKRVLEMASAFWVAALAVTLLARSIAPFYLAFALMGFGNAGTVVADLSIIMEFGPVEERPTYVGLARTITGPAIFLAPLLGGALIDSMGFQALFGAALAFSLAGMLLLWIHVRDPRHLSSVTDLPQAEPGS